MLKFAISLMRKMAPAAEANVPRVGIMAKLQSGNSCLRNNRCELEKHLEARAKVLEAIDDLSDQDTPYVTSLQHVKLLDRLRRGDNLTEGKGLLNSDGTPETKLQAKMRWERESKLPKVPLWHGDSVVIHEDLGTARKSAIRNFCRAKRIKVREHKVIPAGVRTE